MAEGRAAPGASRWKNGWRVRRPQAREAGAAGETDEDGGAEVDDDEDRRAPSEAEDRREAVKAKAVETRRRVQEQFWRLRELQQTGGGAGEGGLTFGVAFARPPVESNDDDDDDDGDAGAKRRTMGRDARRFASYERNDDDDDDNESGSEDFGDDSENSESESGDQFDAADDEDEVAAAKAEERARRRRRRSRRRRKAAKKAAKKAAEGRDGASYLEIFKKRAVKPAIVLNEWSEMVMNSKQMQRIEERRRAGKAELRRIRNGFLESPEFIDMVDQAFSDCDLDGSDSIDKAELYAGVLLLYHNLNRIPWGGRKPPPTRTHVLNIMKKYDFNEDNTLDREEFLALCQDLCQNVVMDVSKRIILVILVFPMLAQPLKPLLEDLLVSARLGIVAEVLANIPSQIFTSIAVALMITALPYVEANLPAGGLMHWDAVTDLGEETELERFHNHRFRKVISVRAAKEAQDRERSRVSSLSRPPVD